MGNKPGTALPNGPAGPIPGLPRTAGGEITSRVPMTTQPVRCPVCRRMLQPPPGATRFRCPCNQVLMAPTPRPVHVKCPRCNATLAPPEGAETFRCVCGVALRTPVQRGIQGGMNVENQTGANAGGGGKFEDETLLPDEIAMQIKKPNEEYWIRNPGMDNKLYWVRLLSEEQEERQRKLLEECDEDMKKRIDDLTADDMQLKLENMGMQKELESAFDKSEMKALLLNAKEYLKKNVKKPDLIARLNRIHVDHIRCRDNEDFIDKLVAAAWYGPTRFSDGFVRKFINDFDMEMVPAQLYAMDVDFKTYGISTDDIERVSQASFRDKVRWFRDQCKKNQVRWEEGRVQIKIRRNDLLRDSFTNFTKLKPEDLRRYLRFEFIGEEGVDAGGVAREWFELVTDACFNVDCGLWEYSGVDNICYQINPSSGIANDLHLQYFHFLGRVVGKALFDHKFIRAHVTQPIYKHILGWPITMKDIEFSDVRVFQSLQEMETAENVEDYLMTFTTTNEVFGETTEVELKPGGGDIEVTNNNLQEYLQLMTKYIMFQKTKGQLGHFLRGIYDVIPPVWLAVFDYRELELLLCGLPNINVADWKANTKYRGVYAAKGESHKVVKWFWEVVEASSQEQRALILQYCTGTSRVPVQGFSALQGNDGNIKPFTIDSAKVQDVLYPKAHTCFNRIELPMYKSKEDLIKRFEEALKQGTTGFSDE